MNQVTDEEMDKEKCKGGYLYPFFIIMRTILVICGGVHFFRTGRNLMNPIDILVFIGMLIMPEFYFVIAAFGCNAKLAAAIAEINRQTSIGSFKSYL